MLFGVHFDGPLRGWAVGENGTILHSTDGATWQPQTGGTRATDLYSIFGTGDAKTLWAVGQHGAILHSADGATWQPQTSGTTNELYSIFGTSDGRTLWAVGEGGTILHSTDGATWQPQTSGTTNGLHFIYGTGDGKTLWAVGERGEAVHSNDMGRTWSSWRYSYRPAPWVWLALTIAALLLAVGLVRLRRPKELSRASIENSALSDQPATNLKYDLLDAADTVRALAEFLRNRNTEPPVTLSIEGRWGLGKTSLMRMLESELCRARVPTVWFNAWHNEGEQQMLAFLLESIRQSAFPAWWNVREIPFRLRLLVVRFEGWPVILVLLAAAALFIIHPALDWLRGADTVDVKNLHGIVDRLKDLNWAQLVTIATALGAAIPLVRKVLRLATGISAQPSDLLSDSDSKSSNAARTSFRTRFAREFKQAIQAFGPDRRITVFIDDLDRCQPEQVRQTLEAVNFLVSSAGCFVVMGIVRDVVEGSVGLGFKELAEELAELDDAAETTTGSGAVDSQAVQARAAKARQRFARNYLLKLINFTVTLHPYSGRALANVAASTAIATDRPSILRQAIPYLAVATTILATVLLWDVHKIPHVPIRSQVLPEESYTLPNSLSKEQLASLVVERDASGKVVGEKRTYAASEKATDQKPARTPASGLSADSPPGRREVRNQNSSETGVFQAGQTHDVLPWLWWMLPLLIVGAGLTARGLTIRHQRIIRDSKDFRDALRNWQEVYENEIRTPREIKRFVNELRYKAIRFRGPQAQVPVRAEVANEAAPGALPREPALILLALLERLNKNNQDPKNAPQWLSDLFQPNYLKHIELFGEPTAEDWDRYQALFGDGSTGHLEPSPNSRH